ncbi:12326_t:CDS:2, partial [Racocetra fulgida]
LDLDNNENDEISNPEDNDKSHEESYEESRERPRGRPCGRPRKRPQTMLYGTSSKISQKKKDTGCDVTDIIIQNCWCKTGILPDTSEVEMEFEYQESENNLDDDEVAEIITD